MTEASEARQTDSEHARWGWWQASPALILAATTALATQNAILFLAFLTFLGGASSLTLNLANISFIIDFPAIALFGIGLFSFSIALRGHWTSNTNEIAETTRRGMNLLTLSGSLCMASALLTLFWRWVIPFLIRSDFQNILFLILDSEGGLPGELSSYEFPIRAMFYLWIAASATLTGSAYLLRFSSRRLKGEGLVEERLDLRSWEGFTTLNAIGTVLVAAEMLQIIGGNVGGPLLLAGIFLKVTVVPLNGTFAYSYIARRAAKLRAEIKRLSEIIDSN